MSFSTIAVIATVWITLALVVISFVAGATRKDWPHR